jgi:hypothetical protein
MGNCFSTRKTVVNIEVNQTYATPYFPTEIGKELGGVEEKEMETYSASLLLKYKIQEGIASGLHWSAVKGVRKQDKKQVRKLFLMIGYHKENQQEQNSCRRAILSCMPLFRILPVYAL